MIAGLDKCDGLLGTREMVCLEPVWWFFLDFISIISRDHNTCCVDASMATKLRIVTMKSKGGKA